MATIFGPATRNFTFVKGTTFLSGVAFTLRHKATGVLFDLTDATASMTLRDSSDNSLIIALTESTSPGLTLGGVMGTIRPNVTSLVTDTWTAPIIDYDLWVASYDGGTDNTAFLCGKITLKTSPSSSQ